MSGQAEIEDEKQQQIISGPSQTFHRDKLERLRIANAQTNLCVTSVIGIQGTGKSTFLNQCFGTRLRVLNSANSVKTTDGVTLCVRDRLYILDFEGSDSNEGTSQIENRLALFAFYVSDVVLVNIEKQDFGHRTSALKLMLSNVLSARLKIGKGLARKTLAIALLRNPKALKQETLQEQSEEMRVEALNFFNKAWEAVEGNVEGRSFTDMFSFDAIPLRYDSEHDKLNEFDLNIVRTRIRGFNQDYQTNYKWICHQWETAWKEILQNDRLDTPDYQKTEEQNRLLAKYWELRTSLLQPWIDKLNQNIYFDNTWASKEIINDFIRQIVRSKWTKNSLDYIDTVIKIDLKPIIDGWDQCFSLQMLLNMVREPIAQVGGAIAENASKYKKYLLMV